MDYGIDLMSQIMESIDLWIINLNETTHRVSQNLFFLFEKILI